MKQIKKIIIEGEKVRHVGYRPFLMAKARRLRIPDYESDIANQKICNKSRTEGSSFNVEEDGKQRVIVSVGGDEKQVNEFIDFVKNNYPPEARVSEVKEAEPPESVLSIDEYQKILDTEQHSTTVQAGLGMIDMQKETIGLQKQTVDMQKQTIDEVKTVGGKIDNFARETKEDFATLRQDYGKISEIMENMAKSLEKMAENPT